MDEKGVRRKEEGRRERGREGGGRKEGGRNEEGGRRKEGVMVREGADESLYHIHDCTREGYKLCNHHALLTKW